jgi:hypothetical protein
MTSDRNTVVLAAGLKAAHERMSTDKALRRPEYPRDFHKLRSRMEDEVYALIDALAHEKPDCIQAFAADVIVTCSEMIEYAGLVAKVKDAPWDTED